VRGFDPGLEHAGASAEWIGTKIAKWGKVIRDGNNVQ
jgi:hypothetical protein